MEKKGATQRDAAPLASKANFEKFGDFFQEATFDQRNFRPIHVLQGHVDVDFSFGLVQPEIVSQENLVDRITILLIHNNNLALFHFRTETDTHIYGASCKKTSAIDRQHTFVVTLIGSEMLADLQGICRVHFPQGLK